jgi:hypothetical protein
VQVATTDDQLIVALRVGQQTGDRREFVPMMAAAQAAATELRRSQRPHRPDHRDGAGRRRLRQRGQPHRPRPDRLIALDRGGRQHHDALHRPTEGDPPPDAGPREAMAHRLRTAAGARRYKRRGATVEPAIGNLKKIITRFSGRGLQAATAEIDLAAAAFNLLKIHRAAAATG